jgi:uncharacterized protein
MSFSVMIFYRIKLINFKKMKIIIISAFAVLSSHFGFSQGQAQKDSCKVLFKLMRQEEIIKQTFDVISKSTATALQSYLSDPQYQEIIQKILDSNMKRQIEMTYKIMNEDMVDIYVKHYTQNDIENLLLFYRSQVGQKTLDVTPLITHDYMQIYQEKYAPVIQNEMMEEIKNMIMEIQKK